MPHSPRSPRTLVAVATAAALTAGAAIAVTVATQAPAQAATRSAVLNSAASYAKSHGYKVGISVYDTKTGHLYNSGSHGSTFASESLIKVWIAARLLVQGRMHGTTEKRAYKMITQSDDGIANSFYGSVGGDNLINWVEDRYNVNVGSRPIRSNYWGSTRITSDGLVRLYAKMKADKKVSYWLRHAMHGHTKYGSDGFNQSFGLPSAAAGYAAIKQGWGSDYSYSTSNASENSTGFVNSDRYAVAILARGPGSTYGSRIGGAITHMAKTILPGGHFPDAYPRISTVSRHYASNAGGDTLTLTGSAFTKVSKVIVGSTSARFTVRSSTRITVLTPRTPSGRHSVRVVSNHGTSPKAWLLFGSPPQATFVNPKSGSTGGGTEVTLSGHYISNVTRVVLGTPDRYRSATLLRRPSATSLVIRTPAYPAGKVPIRVANGYGVSIAGSWFTFGSPTMQQKTGGDRTRSESPTKSSPSGQPSQAPSSQAPSGTPGLPSGRPEPSSAVPGEK